MPPRRQATRRSLRGIVRMRRGWAAPSSCRQSCPLAAKTLKRRLGAPLSKPDRCGVVAHDGAGGISMLLLWALKTKEFLDRELARKRECGPDTLLEADVSGSYTLRAWFCTTS